jgi:hypothetical protein
MQHVVAGEHLADAGIGLTTFLDRGEEFAILKFYAVFLVAPFRARDSSMSLQKSLRMDKPTASAPKPRLILSSNA